MMSALLGNIAARFNGRPENWAVEALYYLFNASRTTVMALLEVTDKTGFELPSDLAFRLQRGTAADRISNLRGFDTQGNLRLVIRSKFWARPTGHRPESYLRGVSVKRSSLVLFVVPAARVEDTWIAFMRTFYQKSGEFLDACGEGQLLYARAGKNIKLAIASWPLLLSAIDDGLREAGEDDLRSDLQQLAGLIQMQDQAAQSAAEELVDP